MAAAAFRNMWKIFIRRNKVSEATRLKLYNIYVRPILLYNSGTWGVNETCLESLDAFHRRQLRSLLGIRYPQKISNVALYKRCDCLPLRFNVFESRWKLFGHILRRDINIPANTFMQEYFETQDNLKAFRGRRRTCLPIVLDQDLGSISGCGRLKSTADMEQLRTKAQDREQWKIMSTSMLEAIHHTYSEKQKKKRRQRNKKKNLTDAND